MDYVKEVEELKAYKGQEFWRPESGTHRIVFIGEATKVEKEFDGKPTTQIDVPVEVDGKRLLWSITKGKTFASLYGQVMEVAVGNGNKLLGAVAKLRVKSDGKKNDYWLEPLGSVVSEESLQEGLK